jgi:hypothetical protein
MAQSKQPLLVIIARDDSKRHEPARECFAAGPEVEIVLDRRVRERRALDVSRIVPVERRHRERRAYDISRELVHRVGACPTRGRASKLASSGYASHCPPVSHPPRCFGDSCRGVALGGTGPCIMARCWKERMRVRADRREPRQAWGVRWALREPERCFPLFLVLLALGSLVAGSVDGAARLIPSSRASSSCPPCSRSLGSCTVLASRSAPRP